MRNEGLGSWPARRARKTPQRTALIHGDTSITYGELYERTTRLAHALRGLRRTPRRPDRLPGAQPPLLPGDAVRRRHPRRGLRPAQHPPRGPRDRLPAGRLRRQGAGVRPRFHRARRGTAGQTPTSVRTSRSAPSTRRLLAGGRGRADRRARHRRRHLHHHVHLGDDGPPQGRDAHARQHHLERRQRPRRPGRHHRRTRPGLRPVVPHGRAEHAHPAGSAQGRHLRPGRGLRPGGHLRPDRTAPDHLHVRRADHVRPGGPAPALGRRRPVVAADAVLRRLPGADPAHRRRSRSAGSPSSRATA